ncbi:response regulator transcription factor [bacterium]|nr:response regulator transcription factor [bacterium]
MEQVRFFRLIPVYETLYAVIDIAIWSIALSQVLIHGRTLNDPRRRRTALMLFGQYVFIVVTTYLTLYPLRAEGLWYGIRVLFQSSVELIPVLYLRSYLARNYKLPIFTGDLHPDLMPLLNRYQITKRETEIITYICEGKSNREIAETLFISLQTVKDHIYRIFQKTGVKSRIQLSNLVQEHLARPVKIE